MVLTADDVPGILEPLHGREELLEPWMEARLLSITEIARTPPVTLNTEITIIRAFLYWCKEYRGLSENPAAKIKPRQVLQKSPEVYSDEELAQMLKHADPTEAAILLTCCYTGMREQEICSLAWEDVA